MLPSLSSLHSHPHIARPAFSGILSQNSRVYDLEDELMEFQTKDTFIRKFEPIAKKSGSQWELVCTSNANNFGGWAYLCDDETGNHLTFYNDLKSSIASLTTQLKLMPELLPKHREILNPRESIKILQHQLNEFIQSGVGRAVDIEDFSETNDYMTWDEYRASFKPQT